MQHMRAPHAVSQARVGCLASLLVTCPSGFALGRNNWSTVSPKFKVSILRTLLNCKIKSCGTGDIVGRMRVWDGWP